MVRRRVLAYLPALLWMSMIFIASTDLGSSQRTSRIIGPILRWFNPEVTDDTIRAVQAVIRKSAHVLVYAGLAALTWAARRMSRGVKLAEGGWSWPEMWGIVAFCAAYAVSDELHQSFVRSRMGSAWDVGFDSIGAVLALTSIWALGRCKKRW
ncbi:MAG: VanZ family protein [Limisphaerales bacterium]